MYWICGFGFVFKVCVLVEALVREIRKMVSKIRIKKYWGGGDGSDDIVFGCRNG